MEHLGWFTEGTNLNEHTLKEFVLPFRVCGLWSPGKKKQKNTKNQPDLFKLSEFDTQNNRILKGVVIPLIFPNVA